MNKSGVHRLCREWAAGKFFPLEQGPEAAVNELRALTSQLTESWWTGIANVLESADDAEVTYGLALLLRALLLNGGSSAEERAVEEALRDRKWAAVLFDALGFWTSDGGLRTKELLGKDRYLDRYLSYLNSDDHTSDSEWDMWTSFVFDDLVEQSPAEALDVLIRIIEMAGPDIKLVEYVGAGPLEDLIQAQAQAVIDLVEHEAQQNEGFRKALSQLWLSNLDPKIFARLETAARTKLARQWTTKSEGNGDGTL